MGNLNCNACGDSGLESTDKPVRRKPGSKKSGLATEPDDHLTRLKKKENPQSPMFSMRSGLVMEES